MKLFIFFLLLFNFFIQISTKLLGLFLITSNGITTPPYFNNYTKFLYFNYSLDQLSTIGNTQLKLLGRWFGEHYIYNKDENKILNNRYNPKELIVYSCPEQKCISSAEAFIQGLYPTSITIISAKNLQNKLKFKNKENPPIKGFKLRNYLGNDEIPINVEQLDKNILFGADDCSFGGVRISEFLDKEHKMKAIPRQDLIMAIEDLRTQIPWAFKNKTIPYTEDLMEIFYSFVNSINNLSDMFYILKESTKNTINYFTIKNYYETRLNSSKGKKFLAAGFIDELINHFSELAIKDKQFPKLLFYSGKRINLINIIVTIFDNEFLKSKIDSYFVLDNKNFLIPDDASSLIFEIHEIEHEKLIRVFYNGEQIRQGFIKKIKYNEKLDGINLIEFINVMKDEIDMEYKFIHCENYNAQKEFKQINEEIFPNKLKNRRYFDWN